MISASKEFKEKLKNGANLVNYADITLSDGTVLNLTYKDFRIGGCSIEDKTTDGKFGVGYCIGKMLSVRLENNDERFSPYDFYMSVINLYVGMLLDNGKIEKIRKGVYYATVPETQGDIIQVSTVDGMYRLDRDYSASTTSYPAALQRIITDVCLDCGIPVGFRHFRYLDIELKKLSDRSLMHKKKRKLALADHHIRHKKVKLLVTG